MAKITDEMLMAFADGQLDPAEAKEVEAMLAMDAAAAQKVEALRGSLDLARTVLERPLREPVPQPLIDTILGSGGDSARVVQLRPRWLPAARATWAVPLAAALALTIGITTYLGANRRAQDTIKLALGPVDTASPLSVVLEKSGSGEGTTLPGTQVTALVIATFADAQRRPCREFELLGPEQHPVEIAVACRESGGQWQVVGAATVPAAQATNGVFMPAGDRSDDPLQAVLKGIGAGVSLSPEDEATLISNGWIWKEDVQ